MRLAWRGTCTVLADQAGNASYQPAPQVQQSFTVSPPAASGQTIAFTSTAPSGAVVGGPSYTISATASSGLPVSFTAAPSSAGVCTVSGATVALVGAGTCTVNANQAGNASYLPAPQVQQSFTVSAPAPSSQTITFTSTGTSGARVGGPAYGVSASASSGLPVSFSAAASSAGICTMSGSTVSFGVGTCTVNANQAGNASYQAAPQVQQSFAIAQGTQTITFTSDPGRVDRNDPPYTVTAVASSGLAVTFTADPSSAGVCTVSGSTAASSVAATAPSTRTRRGTRTTWRRLRPSRPSRSRTTSRASVAVEPLRPTTPETGSLGRGTRAGRPQPMLKPRFPPENGAMEKLLRTVGQTRPAGALLAPPKAQLLRARATPVVRYAVLVFLLAATLIAAVVVTLDRNARRSTWQQNTTELRGGARVSAAAFDAVRANLRVQASQLATSLPLQRAVVTRDEAELGRLARARQARIVLDGRTYGTLAPTPRIASTATITDGMRVLARVTIALPLGKDVLALIRQATPLPSHAALMLVRNGRVIAGGPAGAQARLRNGRVVFGATQFAAESAPLGVANTSVVAVQPVAAIEAQSAGYRRIVFLVAALTLALAALLAMRLARPVARVLGDVARLSRQAGTDALSGLANRRGLNERLDDELERGLRNGTSVSFVLADIDNFKEINDGFGHQAGDNVIRAVARAIAGSVRELDFSARFGGEEFAVILPGSSLADAKGTAERIRRAVAAVEVPGPTGEVAMVTASFGIAEFPTYANAEALVAAADAALYQAKRGGKDQVATATVQAEVSSDDVPSSVASLV